MKQRLILFLTLILVSLTTILSLNAFAAETEEITLMNKNEVVELSNPIIFNDDIYYISIDDLNAINLDYVLYSDENICYVFKLYGNYTRDELKYYLSEIPYIDDIYYLPLNDLANEYSNICDMDTENNIINLWINDYTTETYNIVVTVPDSIEMPENGLNINIYHGTKPNRSISTGSSGYAEHVGYEGTDTDIPSASDITQLSGITVKDETTIAFTDEKRTETLTFDISVRNKIYTNAINGQGWGSGNVSSGGISGGGGISGIATTKYIGYYIDDEMFIGGNRIAIDEYTTDITLSLEDIYPLKHIYGDVIIPVQDTDVSFTIYAEGNITKKYNDNGSYSIVREKTFKTTGLINAGETTIPYSLAVLPGLDYNVHIVFDNGNFIRQQTSVSHLESDINYTFKDFVKSNIITGNVVLPSDMNTFSDYYDNELTEIYGVLTLQQAEAPYYYIDTADICINTNEKTAEFTLVDDIGMNEAVIYYSLYDVVKGINRKAHYKNNQESAAHIKNAGKITPSDNNIVINIQKANTITTELTFPNDEPDLSLTALVYETETPTDNYIKIVAEQTGYNYGDEYTVLTYIFDIPDEYTYYSVQFTNNMYGLQYYTEDSICVKSSENFDVFSAKTASSQSFTYSGYVESVPLILNNIEFYDDYVYINYSNPSGTDYDEVECYLAVYDKTGKLIDVFSDTYYISSRCSSGNIMYGISSETISKADYYKCFLWTENIIPLSEKLKENIPCN